MGCRFCKNSLADLEANIDVERSKWHFNQSFGKKLSRKTPKGSQTPKNAKSRSVKKNKIDEMVKEISSRERIKDNKHRPVSTKNKKSSSIFFVEVVDEVECEEIREGLLATLNNLLREIDFLITNESYGLDEEKAIKVAELAAKYAKMTRKRLKDCNLHIYSKIDLMKLNDKELVTAVNKFLDDDCAVLRFETSSEEKEPINVLIEMLCGDLTKAEKMMIDEHFSEITVLFNEEEKLIQLLVIKRRSALKSNRDSLLVPAEKKAI